MWNLTIQQCSNYSRASGPLINIQGENDEQEQATESDADSDSTINYSTIADNQPIISDLQPCQQRNISSAPVQEI